MAGGFYDADRITQVAVNLFYGWGYNFYRSENQLRTDDQMVRAKASDMLATSRASLAAAELSYRLVHLPPPTRDKPLPDPEAMRTAQALEQIGGELGTLEGLLRSLPVPEADRMTQRFRQEQDTLALLVAADQQMIGHAEAIGAVLAGASGPAIVAAADRIRAHFAALREAIQQRGDLLQFSPRR